MDTTVLLAALGPIIALAVSFLKRVPFVAANPKIVAGVLALAASLVTTFVVGSVGVTTAAVINMIISALVGTSTAVASYEVATNH